MRNRNKYAASVRNNPYNASTPILKNIDAVLSHIAKRRAFVAPKFMVDDWAMELSVRGDHHVMHGGVVRGYAVRNYGTYVPLFYWDKQTNQWFGDEDYRDHPLAPFTPPDKSVKFVDCHDLYLIMVRGVMGAMEAKLDNTASLYAHALKCVKRGDNNAWWFVGDYYSKRYRGKPVSWEELRVMDLFRWVRPFDEIDAMYWRRLEFAQRYVVERERAPEWRAGFDAYLYADGTRVKYLTYGRSFKYNKTFSALNDLI